MPRKEGTLTIEDAKLVYRNFAGKEGPYNREGDRNFCVLLTPELATEMAQDGWNIKTRKAREEGDEPTPYIQVSIGYKVRPPKIVMITSRSRTELGESELEILDWVDIEMADLIIVPYNWNMGGATGISAYLRSLYITVYEDDLERKYAEDVQVPGGEDDD